MADTQFRKYGNMRCPTCLFVKSACLTLPKPGSRKPPTLHMCAHNDRSRQQCSMTLEQVPRDQWPEWTAKWL